MASLETFLAPIPAPSPSGIDLRNDARFHALERQLVPATRAIRIRNPDSEPAVDWSDILRQCADLAGEGRDLRLLVIVVRALAHSDGLVGVAQGLSLIADTVEAYWPTLHPELRDRPSPREAAVRRINALLQLENEEDGLLCDLKHRVFVTLRGLGRFTGADLAAGSLSRTAFLNEAPSGLGESEKAALAAQHEARSGQVRQAVRALAAENPVELSALVEGAEAACAALSRLEDQLSANVAENGVGVTFSKLRRFLDRLAATVRQPDVQPEIMETGSGAEGGTIQVHSSHPGMTGQVVSRQDVETMLDRIIEFYERTEPSSPIPLLARRLRRMVPMTFIELMEEMAPSGLKEVRLLAGAGDEKAKS